MMSNPQVHGASLAPSQLVGLLLVCLSDAHSLVIDARCCTAAENVGPLIWKLDRALTVADATTAADLLAYRSNLTSEYGICSTVGCLAETFMDRRHCASHGSTEESGA
jgi:hypothetical protein